MKKRIGFTYLAALFAMLAGCGTSNNPAGNNSSLLTPMLYSPTDGSTGLDISPRLTWTKVNDAAMYNLQVSTTTAFANTVFADSMILGDSTTISQTALGLSPNTNYYWRARARNANRASSWTNPWHFSTIIVAPVLKTPASGVVDQPITVTLTWDTGGTLPTMYRLQVSTSSNFGITIAYDSTLTSCTKTIGSLSNSTTYYWRTNAKSSAGVSQWSDVWNFTIVPLPPESPVLASPVNGATGISFTPTLTWGTVIGATTYRVQLSTDYTFANLALDDSTVSVENKTVSTALPANTTYYWRVNAKNAGGTGSWSAIRSFTTLAPPESPVLASPVNGATGISFTPTLTWGTVIGATTYRVQLSTDYTFANLALDDSTVSVENKTVSTALPANTTYYWRVNAKNAGGTGSWSAIRSFTTLAPPESPVLASPVNGATGISFTPTLTWGTVIGATTYRVQLSTDYTFANLALDDSTVSVENKTVSTALPANTTYYWRVNAKNAGGTGSWSAIRSFTTLAPPESPVLASPVNGATGISFTPTLTWGTVIGATTYRVQLSTDYTFANLALDDSTVSVENKTVSTALPANTTYYWRVNAKNAGGTGSWSAIRSFTTLAPPESPVLASPVNGATGISFTPTLTWGTVIGATTYRVQLSTDYTFANLALDDSTVSVENKTVSTALPANTTYYWRVNAKNAGGTGSWSAIRSFTTLAPPESPVLASPVNGATGISSSPTFIWSTATGAVTYHLQVSTDISFGSIIIDDSSLSGTSKTIVNLGTNTMYYWRLAAINSVGVSAWTNAWSFTISSTITDADGNVYTTITIGTQTWTVENLTTTKYNDGSAIPLVTDAATWANLATPGYCWYNNDIKTYGALYNWYAVNTGKLAPAGWHVPTDTEWNTLQNYLIANGYNWDGTTAGNKTAKSIAAQTGWATNPNTGTIGYDLSQNNRSGFSALPGGYRLNDGIPYGIDCYGYWWSATEYDASYAYCRYLFFDSDNLFSYNFNKSCGFSVRLLRNN